MPNALHQVPSRRYRRNQLFRSEQPWTSPLPEKFLQALRDGGVEPIGWAPIVATQAAARGPWGGHGQIAEAIEENSNVPELFGRAARAVAANGSRTMKEDRTMIFFPNQTLAHPDDVREPIKQEFRKQAALTGPREDEVLWDVVDQASWDSFPASDPPSWTLGYTGPPATG